MGRERASPLRNALRQPHYAINALLVVTFFFLAAMSLRGNSTGDFLYREGGCLHLRMHTAHAVPSALLKV